jgi:Putative transposase, YhgA-like
MAFFDQPPLHDFPDRAIRSLQSFPAHLRELVQDVAPQIVPRLDFDHSRPLERDFPLPDWRRREADLLFHVPFRGEADQETLVCLLIEHQSAADPPAPLRTLWYAVLYWERQWRAWSDQHQRGKPLALHPVLPILLHTGAEPWTAARGLRELMTGPPDMHAHVPDWRPLFFDLAERTPEALLQAAGHWLPALAVVRAEGEEQQRFEAVLTDVLRRMADLHDTDRLRWSELLQFVLSWGLRRRPRAERQTVYNAVLASHRQSKLREEMEQMAHVLGQTWEQELLARGREIGKEEGKTSGKTEEARALLLRQGRKRFGEPDAATVAALEAIDDLPRLERMSEVILDASGWADVLKTP